MLAVEEIDGGLRVVDAAKNEVEIEIEDWEPGGEELEIGHGVMETRTGWGSEVRLPRAGFLVESSELSDPRILNMNERLELEAGEHLFRLSAIIDVYIRLTSSQTVVAENANGKITLSFPFPTCLTLGFRELKNTPRQSLIVPPTLEGATAALEECASIHETVTPDRSFPSERPVPPSIRLAERSEIDELRGVNPENPIRFRLPRSFEFLFQAAPLVFYTGAGVTVERRKKPLLEVGSETHALSPDSGFAKDVAALLRRVFYLDCLVREAGPRRLGIKEFELLDDAPIDPERLYGKSMPERIRSYLEFPFDSIASSLPDWPLGTYVEPTVENLPAIPYLLDRLSLIFPPESSPIDGRTMVQRSLGDFYRSTVHGSQADNPVKILSTEGHRTRVQGWMATGSPIDAFKCPPEAFENQREYLVSTSEPISITVVLNDDVMAVEHSKVHQIYRDRAEELSVELTLLENASTEELSRVFSSPCDFIHYIGHCDPSGLRCTDGNMSADELPRSRARTFFLNACGSYSEGLELVRKGSVAGAVTFGDVIDAQAAKVGVDFARLYMFGYTIERSLFHARGRAIINRQYGIVGDGTHVLTQGDSIQPAVIYAASIADGNYSVKLDAAPVNLNGGVLLAYTDSAPNLMGNHTETHVDQSEFEEFLSNTNDPIIYDNKFYWPEELLEELF